MTLSQAQNNVGQLSEATKSMEKAVELARTDDDTRILPNMCAKLARLYEQIGRPHDARRLTREATSLS
jgi:Flp pilus assembly protein TadD